MSGSRAGGLRNRKSILGGGELSISPTAIEIATNIANPILGSAEASGLLARWISPWLDLAKCGHNLHVLPS